MVAASRLGVGILLLLSAPLHAVLGVRGQVLDARGEPLVGARVELTAAPSSYEQGLQRLTGRDSAPVATTTTDALGRYVLAAPGSGVFAVRIAAPGKVPLSFDPLALVEETELPPAVPPGDVGARLLLRDAAGRGAAGLWVLAEGVAAGLPGGWQLAPRVGRTAADGRVALPRLADEKLRVRVFHGMGDEESHSSVADGEVRLAAALVGERRLRVAGARGEPAAGVLVRVGEAAWPAGLTDTDGRLSLRTRAAGLLRIRLITSDGRQLAVDLPPASGIEMLVLADAPPRAGRVLRDEDRRPLAEALVWSRGDPGTFSRTDGDGRYHLPTPLRRAVSIEATAAGRLPRRARFEAASAGAAPAPAIALPRAGEIAGRVVDVAGVPLAGAWISARERAAEGPADAAGGMSDDDGAFRLRRLRRGEPYAVKATKYGYLWAAAAMPVLAEAGRPSSLVLVLAPTRPAMGRVVDADGQAVAGAEVRLRAAAALSDPAVSKSPAAAPGEQPAALSDVRGRFAVAAIPALTLDVEVVRPGYARGLVRNFKVPPSAGVVDLGTIALRPASRIEGVVVDPAERPITGANVYTAVELPPAPQMAEQLTDEAPAATSGADGRFAVADQPRGLPVNLLVSARGFLPQTVRGVKPPTTSPLRVRLRRSVDLAVRVLSPERTPIAGASVTVDVRAATVTSAGVPFGPEVVKDGSTGTDGRVELTGLPQGRGALAVSAVGFVAIDGLAIALPQAAKTEETVVLARGATLEGRVTTTAGDPVADVHVTAGSAGCFSDADGFFGTDGVPLGQLTVQAFHPDYPRLRRKLEIEEGTNHVELVFPAGTTVRGRVVDAARAPVAGASAILEPERRGGGPSYQARADDAGGFTLEPVTAGHYRLEASADGYVTTQLQQPVNVAAEPVEGLEIVLEAGAAVSGNLLGLTREELSRVAVHGRHESGESAVGQVDASGRYALRHLAAGGWLIEASLTDEPRQARARVLLSPGGEETRDLRFGGLTLSGRVVYREEPLVDAVVAVRGQRLAVERSTTTDYEGVFRFADLEADTYWLGLKKADELLAHNEMIDLTVDRDVLIRLERRTVTGTVKDAASEEPIAAAGVALRHLPGSDGLEFVIAGGSDKSGAFRLERVPPGRYRLTASHAGYGAAEREIEVPDAGDPPAVELSLQPTAGAEVVVRCASGATPELLHLRLLAPSGAVQLAESRRVGKDGKVRLSTAPPGDWLLVAASADCAVASTPLTVPGERAMLLLPDAARLGVRVPSLATSDTIASVAVVATDGRALQTIALGGTLQQSWPLVAGHAMIEEVPAGSWIVSATAPDGRRWSTGVVTDGRTTVEIELE